MASRNKAGKFVELANKRVNRAIKDLKLIGNLANRNNYEYTPEQAKKIFRALQDQVDEVRQKFQDSRAGEKDEFVL